MPTLPARILRNLTLLESRQNIPFPTIHISRNHRHFTNAACQKVKNEGMPGTISRMPKRGCGRLTRLLRHELAITVISARLLDNDIDSVRAGIGHRVTFALF